MQLKFETEYTTISEKIDQIDSLKYGSTRNNVDGAVTYFSPYISRSVFSTKQLRDFILKKRYKILQITSFVKELCWRNYLQRVAQLRDFNKDTKQGRISTQNTETPSQIIDGTNGINGIDSGIKQLYQTGYMHNHSPIYRNSLT